MLEEYSHEVALVRSLAAVYDLVASEAHRRAKRLPAHCAFVRTIARVDALVNTKLRGPQVRLAALVTFKLRSFLWTSK